MRCPICDKSFNPADSSALPFCSERCRSIDLGRWLGEAYSLPLESVPLEHDAQPEDETSPREGRARNVP
jgi:endogenous inhibitor of DNA gyrase (YacG/DUF329 family)